MANITSPHPQRNVLMIEKLNERSETHFTIVCDPIRCQVHNNKTISSTLTIISCQSVDDSTSMLSTLLLSHFVTTSPEHHRLEAKDFMSKLAIRKFTNIFISFTVNGEKETKIVL